MFDLKTTIHPAWRHRQLRGAMQYFFCVLLLVFLGTSLPASAAERRVALVVGNADYADKPLRNPVNDAELMQRTLQGLGFDVSLVRNADRRTLLAGLRDFEAKARNADVALFFYAGHGAQVSGANYLIPLNAQIRAESDVPDEAVDATSVLRRIEDAKARVGLVILDACRDNPYTGATRSSTRGLARMSVPTGSIVAYATAPGYTADDGKGANGVYTEQLTRHLNQSGLDLREVFDRTALEVERLTNGKQKPREDVGLRGRIVLNPGATPGAGERVATIKSEPVPIITPATNRPTIGKAEDPETQFWNEVKANGTKEYYDTYVKQFPKGKYVPLAKVELKKLEDQKRVQKTREAAEAARQEAEKTRQSAAAEKPAHETVNPDNGVVLDHVKRITPDEQRFWVDEVKGGTKSLEEYVKAYPNGKFATCARIQIAGRNSLRDGRPRDGANLYAALCVSCHAKPFSYEGRTRPVAPELVSRLGEYRVDKILTYGTDSCHDALDSVLTKDEILRVVRYAAQMK